MESSKGMCQMNELTVSVQQELAGVTDSERDRILMWMSKARAQSTKNSYQSHLKKFLETESIPSTPARVALWLIEQVENRLDIDHKPYTKATLMAWLVAIRLAHLAQGFADPTNNIIVSDVFEGLMREFGKPQKRAKVLSYEEILSMVAVCKSDNWVKDLRDKVLILLGYTGGFRINELLTLDCKQIFISDNPKFDGFEILMGRTKTDQAGAKGFKKLIPMIGKKSTPGVLLREWLGVVKTGVLLRAVDKTGQISSTRLSYSAALKILRERAHAAKIKNFQAISTHSLRRSFVTNSYKNKKTNQEISKQTHQSSATINRYIEDGNVYENNPVFDII